MSREPIDLPALRRRCIGQSELIAQLLDMFVETLPASIARVRAAVETGTPRDLSESAHALKGMAANLNASGVESAAAELELIGRDAVKAGATDLPAGRGAAAPALARLEAEAAAALSAVPGVRANLGPSDPLPV